MANSVNHDPIGAVRSHSALFAYAKYFGVHFMTLKYKVNVLYLKYLDHFLLSEKKCYKKGKVYNVSNTYSLWKMTNKSMFP